MAQGVVLRASTPVIDEETSLNSECSESHADHISSANSISVRDDADSDHQIEEYDAQQQFLEQVKHDKTELEAWKTEVGEVAVEKVARLSLQIEELQTNAQQLQLDMDGMQQENTTLKQQIGAYVDEIEKFNKEQPKMQSQINDFQQRLREQYTLAQQHQDTALDLSDLKTEYECAKQSLKNANLELKTVRTENATMKRENERYQSLLDTLRRQEHTLTQQVSEQQAEIASLSERYKELNSHLQEETEETRKQLHEARHIARNLSDQLEEVTNLQNMDGASLFAALQEDVDIDDDDVAADTEAPVYGRSPLEKRRTLKLLATPDESLLKLPRNASFDDEGAEGHFGHFASGNMHAFTALKNMNHRRSSLPPVSEFHSVDMDARTECEFDEKHVSAPIIVKTSMNYTARTWAALLKRRHSDSSVFMKDNTALPQGSEEEDEDDDDGASGEYDAARLDRRDSALSSVTLHSMHKLMDDDSIETLLRRICGSYPKPGVVATMDGQTRHLLRYVVQRVRDEHLDLANDDKQQMMTHFEQELKELQTKYRALKRALKKRKAVDAQQQQRVSSELVMSGCKFWTWSTWSLGTRDNKSTAQTPQSETQ